MLDDQGRLFGRLNMIDLSLGIIFVAIVAGFALVKMGYSPINKVIKGQGMAEVNVAIRGARVLDTGIFKVGEKAFLTIRNQRYAPVEVTQLKISNRQTVFLGKNDQLVVKDDPTAPEIKDINMTFREKAEVTDEGIVMGGHHLKVGTSVELDAFNYRLNATIMQVKFTETAE